MEDMSLSSFTETNTHLAARLDELLQEGFTVLESGIPFSEEDVVQPNELPARLKDLVATMDVIVENDALYFGEDNGPGKIVAAPGAYIIFSRPKVALDKLG